MKLIIDIPEAEYKTLSKMSEKEKVNELSYYEKIIANGIPLPKRHGRLIDENHVIAELVYRKNLLADDVTCGQVTEIFDSAVVVEADKESNNADSN